MAYKLIRANSDTPNIYNKDDVRMIRYAYNGYSGFIPKIGGELGWNYDNEAGVFSLSSGLLVLEGWEVYIDEEGWKWNIPLSTGVFAVSIYLSLNALANIVKIEGKYSTDTNYPEIEPGDDLSVNPDGSANLLLYTFVINNSTIQDVQKQVKPIPRLDSVFEENRTTIKNATTSINSTNSANVTSKINNKNITDIFEADGITVKSSKILKNIESYVGYNIGTAVSLPGIYVVNIVYAPTDNSLNNGKKWSESVILAIPNLDQDAWNSAKPEIKYSGEDKIIYVPKISNANITRVYGYIIAKNIAYLD